MRTPILVGSGVPEPGSAHFGGPQIGQKSTSAPPAKLDLLSSNFLMYIHFFSYVPKIYNLEYDLSFLATAGDFLCFKCNFDSVRLIFDSFHQHFEQFFSLALKNYMYAKNSHTYRACGSSF